MGMDFSTVQRAEVQQLDTPAPSVPGLTQLCEQPVPLDSWVPLFLARLGQAHDFSGTPASAHFVPWGLKGRGGTERKVVGISLGGEGFQL